MSDRTVHVVDDDVAVRDSMAFLLAAGRGWRVETWEDGVSFLAALPDVPPGCVLLDLHMPGLSGLEVQARLIEIGSPLPLIILTGQAEVGLAVRAMKAGAVDFIEKPLVNSELFDALEAGFRRLEAPDAGRHADAISLVARLSPRERQVLEELLAGRQNKVIAYRLGLSPRTVELHRAHMMDRLGVRSLSAAVRLALAAGLDPAS